ncbi:hypothetical protein [Dactylosporangium matsuzakiense]|uniref:Uncharacterized protein n=1 Tax=Dactylosporangium matsuzakiense TaxID=53360 RepID=A0A9W6KEH4_9ACTN|nr:hypothetical protein [Dactylosporangium matsuzakiense]GLL00587.1 hypothetical protein GCM10017581_023280 [Dactylosporangium matsuzakiense]
MTGSANLVRDLARSGNLAVRANNIDARQRVRLTAGAYDIVWPVVFERHTRAMELRRSHPACAASVRGLRPECLDRFQDDVEAVLDDLLHNAKVPIRNLEGWIARRINAATVDAHRRRRGARGALQRPRLPQWLGRALGGDPWLTRLAVELLTWVGVPTTAGSGLWPLGAWAELRLRVTGDPSAGEPAVGAEVETVLRAMRQSAVWYANFVERPLGRKEIPVTAAHRPAAGADDGTLLPPGRTDSDDDAYLHALADAAVRAIEGRLGRGEDPADAVRSVVGRVFTGGTGTEELDRVPGTAPAPDERVAALLADPAVVDRITGTVLAILGPPAE